jgi:hypothetical protein
MVSKVLNALPALRKDANCKEIIRYSSESGGFFNPRRFSESGFGT